MADHTTSYAVPVVTFVIAIIVFIFCFCDEKSFIRNHPHLTSTTTVTTQHHPQGSQYQSVPNSPQPAYRGQPMPTGPSQELPYVPGPPPTYQEAVGPGYPVPISQAAYGGQDMYPIQAAEPPQPADYTSPQPSYNPAYVELP